MIKQGKFMLGTIAEIAMEIADKGVSLTPPKLLKEYDFSLPLYVNSEKEFMDYKEYNQELCGVDTDAWFGIKQLETRFDNTDTLNICADYYGGGSLSTVQIFFDWSLQEIATAIKDCIIGTLEQSETVNEDTLLFVECLDDEETAHE